MKQWNIYGQDERVFAIVFAEDEDDAIKVLRENDDRIEDHEVEHFSVQLSSISIYHKVTRESILQDDILERYNNIEYWDLSILDEYNDDMTLKSFSVQCQDEYHGDCSDKERCLCECHQGVTPLSKDCKVGDHDNCNKSSELRGLWCECKCHTDLKRRNIG